MCVTISPGTPLPPSGIDSGTPGQVPVPPERLGDQLLLFYVPGSAARCRVHHCVAGHGGALRETRDLATQASDERRARNALVASRRDAPPIPLAAVPRDSARATISAFSSRAPTTSPTRSCSWNRVRDGAPGVQLVTPLHPDSGLGGDTAVLVDRGWCTPRWRVDRSGSVE